MAFYNIQYCYSMYLVYIDYNIIVIIRGLCYFFIMIKEVVDFINQDIENKYKKFEEDRPRIKGSEKFSLDKFEKIKSRTNLCKATFVDGGNTEIIRSGNFSLHFIRICALTFEGRKKVDKVLNEFFCLAYAEKKDEIFYKTKFFQMKGEQLIEEFEISSFDPSIVSGKFRASISIVPEIVRRFCEIKICSTMIDKMSSNDIFVKDGNLECHYPLEKELFDDLKQNCDAKGIKLSGLAKTSQLFTEEGNNLLALLSSKGPEGCWYYPISKDIRVAKLHPRSGFVFRVDGNDVMPELMANSNDPAFLGYPYGLILVDRFARVSNEEKNHLRTVFMSKFGKKWEIIDKYEHALNAHNVLDSM